MEIISESTIMLRMIQEHYSMPLRLSGSHLEIKYFRPRFNRLGYGCEILHSSPL